MVNQLFLPMFSHVAWTGFLYALLTVMRAPTIWKIGARKDGTNPWKTFESRTSANLSNQFEWPIFFYIACVILMGNELFYSSLHIWLAWFFVIGRILHSFVQICTSNIRLRGVIFTISFIAVFGMWIQLLKTYVNS